VTIWANYNFICEKTTQQARDTSKTNLGIGMNEKFNEVIYNKSGTVDKLRVWGAAKKKRHSSRTVEMRYCAYCSIFILDDWVLALQILLISLKDFLFIIISIHLRIWKRRSEEKKEKKVVDSFSVVQKFEIGCINIGDMFTTDIQTICDHLLIAGVIFGWRFLHAITWGSRKKREKKTCYRKVS
jgi:hypothetical protein